MAAQTLANEGFSFFDVLADAREPIGFERLHHVGNFAYLHMRDGQINPLGRARGRNQAHIRGPCCGSGERDSRQSVADAGVRSSRSNGYDLTRGALVNATSPAKQFHISSWRKSCSTSVRGRPPV